MLSRLVVDVIAEKRQAPDRRKTKVPPEDCKKKSFGLRLGARSGDQGLAAERAEPFAKFA